MISRRSALVIAARLSALGLSALALASCGKAPQANAAKDTVTFSILSTESAQNMEGYWKPILADMEKQTGLKVKPFFSSNYSSLIVAMGAKQTDLGWFSNQSGLEAVRRSNGEVFARTARRMLSEEDHEGYTLLDRPDVELALTLCFLAAHELGMGRLQRALSYSNDAVRMIATLRLAEGHLPAARKANYGRDAFSSSSSCFLSVSRWRMRSTASFCASMSITHWL